MLVNFSTSSDPLDLQERIIKSTRRLETETDPLQTADICLDIAYLHADMGNEMLARPFLKRSLDILENVPEEDNPPLYAQSVCNAIRSLYSLGMLDEALSRRASIERMLRSRAMGSIDASVMLSITASMAFMVLITQGHSEADRFASPYLNHADAHSDDRVREAARLIRHELMLHSSAPNDRLRGSRELIVWLCVMIDKFRPYVESVEGVYMTADVAYRLAVAAATDQDLLRDEFFDAAPEITRWLFTNAMTFNEFGHMLEYRKTLLLISVATAFFNSFDPAGLASLDSDNFFRETLDMCPVHRKAEILHLLMIASQRHGLDPTQLAIRFGNCVSSWRGAIAAFDIRSGLRVGLAKQASGVLEVVRQAVARRPEEPSSAAALAELEDVVGPARWLHERIAASLGTSDLANNIAAGYESWPQAFHGAGLILQVLPVGDDLYIIETDTRTHTESHSFARPSITGASKALRKLHGKYLSRSELLKTQIKKLPVPPGGKASEKYLNKRRRLNWLTRACAKRMARIIGTEIRQILQDRRSDLLIVCPDPALLSLPWSLFEIGGWRLIEHVESLTFNVCVGAAAAAAAPRAEETAFDIAAYCHNTDSHGRNALRWGRLLELLPDATLRSVRISQPNGPHVEIATLNAYSTGDPECSVLLVAGHGDPRKGIWLADGYWKPAKMLKQKWHLKKTECAIFPSCRLGEMQWDGSGEDGEDDPSKSEIIGFTASLCVAGIPRVLACPWPCYDLPVCRLLPMIVKRAMELRAGGIHHYWPRALREVLCDALAKPVQGVGLYDLANLMMFGAP